MIAELPDGTELEFPDDTSPDVIQNIVKQYLSGKPQEASWLDTLEGGAAQLGKNLGLGGLGVAGGIEEYRDRLNKITSSVLGVDLPSNKIDVGQAMAQTKQFYNEADPSRGKQLSTGQRVAQAGTQLGGAILGGPVGIGTLMAGGTIDQATDMLDQGMPLQKAQAFAGADTALNTASMALGGIGNSPVTQGLTAGLGNMGGDELSNELANAFRRSEGIKEQDRDWVDRGISFGMGAVPAALATKKVTEQKDPTGEKTARDEAFSKIDQAIEPPKQIEPRSTLELLPKDQYPEPLGNRTVDPNTNTVTTGMAEDVPTVDFPLRPEALEQDRKFQKLQKDLLTERQILDDWKERGVDEESIKQQEAAVEVARQKLGDYLDQGYGAKQPSDLYGRSIYESGETPALAIERGYDPKQQPKLALEEIVKNETKQKQELSLVDIDPSPVVKDLDFHQKLREHIDNGDYPGALDWVMKERRNSIEGQVAKLLRKLNDTDLKLGSKSNLATERKGVIKAIGGAYIPNEHAVAIDALSAGNLKTFIHEAVHSATSAVLNRVLSGDTKGLSVRERIAGKNIVDLYNGIKNKTNAYGFRNAKEFIAEVFGNPAFRKELAGIKMEGTTAWQRFVDNVRNLVGMGKRYDTALNRALFEGKRLVKASERSTRMADIGKETNSKLLSMDELPKKVRDFFEESLLDASIKWKSREKVIRLPIDTFLRLADELTPAQRKSAAREAAEKGIKWNELPFLSFIVRDGKAKIIGHEGRNRAEYLKSQGHTEMPVKIVGDIRWSEQRDPNLFDYQTEWPSSIKPQRDAKNPNIEEPFFLRQEDAAKETNLDFAPANKLDRFKSFDEFKNSLSPELQKYAAEYWVENGRELPKEEATVSRNEAQTRALESLLQNDERVKYLLQDLRSAEEIKAVVLDHKKDISDNAFRNNLASGGFAMSALVKHPLVHWITSKTMKALKEAEIASDRAISENGKGFLAILKGGTAEMQRDLSIKLRAIEGKETKIELTPYEQKVVESWNKAKDDAITKFNEARAAKGLDPVAPRLNYLASIFKGDMRVLVQKEGKTVGWITGNSRIELDRAMKQFDGEGFTFSPVERIPHARSRDFQKNIARRMAAFDEVIKILGDQDPDVKSFSDRMEASFSKQAYDYLDFKQHFKEKSGVFGAEGMKKWKDEFSNSNDLWNAQADYIRAMHEWVAQQKIEPEVKQILSDPKLRNHSPNAMKLSGQIYDNAFGRGKDNLQLFERVSDVYSQLVNSDVIHAIPGVRNLQRVNPFESARTMKNWILYSALALNPGFMFSQAVQVPAATSTMMTYFHELGFKGNFTAALFHGSIDALSNRPGMKELSQRVAKNFGEKFPNGFQTDVGEYFNNYATENHVVTPHIMDKTALKSKNMVARGIQNVDHFASDSISKLEEGTRRWAFNTLAHYLYDSGVPKERAAEMAEIATSIAMVDYSRQGRAMVYNKLGMLGDMAATVTSFKHNAFTQLFTYASSSAPKTLMVMLGIQGLLGGLTGMYAVDEADQIWKFVQGMAPETLGDLPGVKEFLIRHTPEALAFGGLSAGSRIIMPEGIDFGSKFSMDNAFPDSLSEALFPLMSTLTNTIQAAGKAKNAPTFENVSGVAYPMMPAPVKGLMENFLYSDDKGNFISPKTDQAKTNRSTNEKRLRGLGMRSLDERIESEVTFRTKAKRLREAEQQKQALANIRSYARAGDPKGIAKNVIKYVEGGGTPAQVNNFLIGAAGDRVQSEIQRLSPKTFNTIKQQMQQMDLQQFQQDIAD